MVYRIQIDPVPGDKLSYINYIKNVLTVHVKIAEKLLEFIPEFRTVRV